MIKLEKQLHHQVKYTQCVLWMKKSTRVFIVDEEGPLFNSVMHQEYSLSVNWKWNSTGVNHGGFDAHITHVQVWQRMYWSMNHSAGKGQQDTWVRITVAGTSGQHELYNIAARPRNGWSVWHTQKKFQYIQCPIKICCFIASHWKSID